jgi:hypothetical protein
MGSRTAFICKVGFVGAVVNKNRSYTTICGDACCFQVPLYNFFVNFVKIFLPKLKLNL